jgi:hypothetical protein
MPAVSDSRIVSHFGNSPACPIRMRTLKLASDRQARALTAPQTGDLVPCGPYRASGRLRLPDGASLHSAPPDAHVAPVGQPCTVAGGMRGSTEGWRPNGGAELELADRSNRREHR